MLRRGDHAAARERLEQALEHARAAGDRIQEGRVLNNLGIAHHGMGEYVEALGWFEKALELRRRSGYRRGTAINLHNVGDVHLRLGQSAQAWSAFYQSRDIAVDIGWPLGEVMNEVYLAWIEACRARSQGGIELGLFASRLARASKRADALGDAETAVAGEWLRGRLLRYTEPEAAARVLAAAAERARALGAHRLLKDIEATARR
jgi:Tfp pilus assembly protein PilF